MKKVFVMMIAVLLLAMCVMPMAASAADMTEPQYIYFEVPTGGVAWNNFNVVYCHMWSKLGGDVYNWQTKGEICEDMGNGFWRYDLSQIDFDPEGEYSLIFSNDIGMQTYNLNITSDCQGDIAYCDGDTCVNPVDGEKSCAVARWRNNGEMVHPAIEVDSNGVLLNVDGVAEDSIQTVWGTSEGTSVEFPMIQARIVEYEDSDAVALIAADSDNAVENADGINTNTATVWIIVVCVVLFCAIAVVVIILAKKNKKKSV